MKTRMSSILVAATIILSTFASAAFAQDESAPMEAQTLTVPLQGETPQQAMMESLAGQTIPLWSYWVLSPAGFHTGYIMGHAPGTQGTTYIPTYIIPLIIVMPDGGVFDPTAPNNCAGGNVPLTVVQNSPLFNDAPMVWGGTDLGTTQYIDAQMRGEFWTRLRGLPEWHNKFQATTLNAIVIYVPRGYGYTKWNYSNPCQTYGVVSYSYLDLYVKFLIANLRPQGVGPTSLPLFLLNNVAELSPGFQYLGYHSAYGSPLQVYSVADYDTTGVFKGVQDISILSHELGEAANDPTGMNYTPSWGHIGQVKGCQNNFEVGDPLTGTNNPPITLNGFTYHPQELAFFAWFFRSPDWGVNGWYSTNGTFTHNAGWPPCR